jgi:putative PEP-CTERM system histidine kinase
VAVPLADHGEFLGLIVLADRVDGSPFLPADLEMLECVGHQVAASLRSLHLHQSLAEARQLEAFQGMASFLIHDLKNTSFLLSLMLRNLTEHFEKPAFRADALRAVSQACRHLDDLVRRLGSLRGGLSLETDEADLNDVVSDALSAVPRQGAVALETRLSPVPPIRADRVQLGKVVTNLVLNATEAVAGDGRILVSTGAEAGWAVLTVDDNGCGMTESFLNESLFRPFRTTKPSGLGIGMFQSRSIVEAHGGRITVESRPGAGTVFRVFLRAAPVAAGA